MGIVRTFVAAGGGMLASTGAIEGKEQDTVVGAVMVLVTVAWSLAQKFISKKNVPNTKMSSLLK